MGTKTQIDSGFAVNENKGFSLRFPCGLTLSTQFGDYNYCRDYPNSTASGQHNGMNKAVQSSPDAEIAIFKSSGDREWKTKEIWKSIFGEDPGDDVKGWVTMDQWLKVVVHLASLKPKETQ